MNEKKILATLLSSREAFDKVFDHLDDSDFSSETTLVLKYISEYYVADPKAPHVDLDILLARLKRGLQNPKHFEALSTVLKNLPSASVENVSRELLEIKRYSVGLKLSQALASGRRSSVEQYLSAYNDLWALTDFDIKREVETCGLNLKELVSAHFDRGNLIPLFPRLLNERLDGGAKPGHHILIFAPTEMGKTLLAIHNVGGWLQAERKVLYFGNEDPAADILMRLGSNLSGMTKHEIEANPDEATKRATESGVENFTMVEASPGTFYQARKLVDKHKPDIVVLDQLRNFDVKADGRTQQLEKAATEARNLGKSMGVLVVSITQAADSASGKRILNRGDVDGSNVGIPGQMDVMVGVGATEDEEHMGIRTISFPKNKIGGTHEHFSTSFNPALSRVVE